MRSKLISFTLLILTSNVFAGNWFVGVNGGGNLTRSTPVGDLPMAREEFKIAGCKQSDLAECDNIRNAIISSGGTPDQALAAVAHFNIMQLNYNSGFNVGVRVGYQIKNISVGVFWKYIKINYDAINHIADGDNRQAAIWRLGDGAGATILNSYLAFGEYNIRQIGFYKFIPVVGLGLGFASVEDKLTINSKTAKRDQTIFAYQMKLGINYNLTKQLQANIETVFFGTSKNNATNNYLKQWQFINIGVRWIFD